jgi:hypothetical protein
MSEELDQTEVDYIVSQYLNATPDQFKRIEEADKERTRDQEMAKRDARAIAYALQRYDYAQQSLPFQAQEERSQQLRYYCHRNWLHKNGFEGKDEYRRFMRREALKRGMTLPPRF